MPIVQDTQDAYSFKHAIMRNMLKMAKATNRFVPEEIMRRGGSAAEWMDFGLTAEMPHGKDNYMRTAAFHHAARCWLSDEKQPAKVEADILAALRSRNPDISRPMLDGLHRALYPEGVIVASPRAPHDEQETLRIAALRTVLQHRSQAAATKLAETNNKGQGDESLAACKHQADEVRMALGVMVAKPLPARPASRPYFHPQLPLDRK